MGWCSASRCCLGLLLLPGRLPARALVVGAAVIGLVLAGVFLPTFSMQILNGVLGLAIFIVAVLWTVACAVHCRKCRGGGGDAGRTTLRSAEPGVDLSQYTARAAGGRIAGRSTQAGRSGRRAGQCVRTENNCKMQSANCKMQNGN